MGSDFFRKGAELPESKPRPRKKEEKPPVEVTEEATSEVVDDTPKEEVTPEVKEETPEVKDEATPEEKPEKAPETKEESDPVEEKKPDGEVSGFLNDQDDVDYMKRLVLGKSYHLIGCGQVGAKMAEDLGEGYEEKLDGIKVSTFVKEPSKDTEGYIDPYGHPPLKKEEEEQVEEPEEEEEEEYEAVEDPIGSDDPPDHSGRGPQGEPRRKRLISKIVRFFKRGRRKMHEEEDVGDFPDDMGGGPSDDFPGDSMPDDGPEMGDEPGGDMDMGGGMEDEEEEDDQDDLIGGGPTQQEEKAEEEKKPKEDHLEKQWKGYEAKQKMEGEVKQLMKKITDTDILFTLCSLDDNKGIQNTKTLCKVAKQKEVFNILILTMPRKIKRAEHIEDYNKLIQELRLLADVLVAAPHQKEFEGDLLFDTMKELVHLIDVSGDINLDLADVRTTMKGGNVAILGFGVSDPKSDPPHRSLEAFRECLKHPMFNIDFMSARKVLVNVTGSSDMSVTEAQGVIGEMQSLIKKETPIIWGLLLDASYRRRVHVFLMVGVTPKEVLVHLYATS